MAGIIAGRDAGAIARRTAAGPASTRAGTATRRSSSASRPTRTSSTSRSARATAPPTSPRSSPAIDWVVQHRNDPGLNIKVLSLSYGTNATQPYQIDPLAYAAEVAWAQRDRGRRVGRQRRPRRARSSRTRATTRTILAVGSDDPRGTMDRLDDTVPDVRHPRHRGAAGRRDRPRRQRALAAGPRFVHRRDLPGRRRRHAVPAGQRDLAVDRGRRRARRRCCASGSRPRRPDQIKSLLTGSAFRINANLLFAGKGIVDAQARHVARDQDGHVAARRAHQAAARPDRRHGHRIARGAAAVTRTS